MGPITNPSTSFTQSTAIPNTTGCVHTYLGQMGVGMQTWKGVRPVQKRLQKYRFVESLRAFGIGYVAGLSIHFVENLQYQWNQAQDAVMLEQRILHKKQLITTL